MSSQAKFLIGTVVATLAIVVGGVFFFSKSSGKAPGSVQVDMQGLVSGAKNTIGSESAKVKIVEFADFQCPACGAAHPILKQVLEENKDKVQFVYRHYPLPLHKNAEDAAKAAEAAAAQGKFWEMHDILFDKQSDWSEKGNAKEIFEGYAKELSLDIERYKLDFENSGAAVDSDQSLGNKNSVESTPTFFINGTKYSGVIQKDKLNEIINTLSSQGS